MIALRDLTRAYGDAQRGVVIRALAGVTLEIARGTMVAIMGASGSGKSTLLNLLGCLDTPTSGTYILDGEDVSTLGADRRAQIRNAKIGFVFQSFNLLPRTTARENVELPLVYAGVPFAAHRRRADAALAAVGLPDVGDRTPNQLSGGQQQRVAIARALVNGPRLLLADEPTGNLDTATSIEIMRLLHGLNRSQSLTVVLVTHEPDIAAWTERVLVMRDGRIVGDAPPEQVGASV